MKIPLLDVVVGGHTHTFLYTPMGEDDIPEDTIQGTQYHCWHGFTENGPHWNFAQLWKLFSYITIRILKISFKNCVSSLLSMNYNSFLFTGPFDFAKAQNL